MVFEIQGHKYLGKFSVGKRNGKAQGGGGYYEHEYTNYWWDGQGVIFENNTDPRNFIFKLSSYKESSFKEDFICVKTPCFHTKDELKIIDIKSVYDLFLERMYKEAIKEESGLLKTIFTPTINYYELLEKGLVTEFNSR